MKKPKWSDAGNKKYFNFVLNSVTMSKSVSFVRKIVQVTVWKTYTNAAMYWT
jgi:hypothetical protein